MIVLILPDTTADTSLQARLQAGDREAVVLVYERYFSSLYQYACWRLDDATQAEDMVSEVFVSLLEVLGTPSAPREHLRGWLFRVLRSRLARHATPIQLIDITDSEATMLVTQEGNPDTADWIDIQRVQRALRLLTPDHQEVLFLRFSQHLSLQEAADVMGKSLSAIKSLQFRAISTLRQLLEQPGEVQA